MTTRRHLTGPAPMGKQQASRKAKIGSRARVILGSCLYLLVGSLALKGQGGPPCYTNDPGTPGNRQWEINLGYMPFLYADSSTTHSPDIDINYGLGDRIN